MGDVVRVPEVYSERDAVERLCRAGFKVSEREMREARHAGEIDYYQRGRRFWYSEAQLAAFVARHEVVSCRNDSSNSGDNGSGQSPEPEPSTDSGMTPEHARLVAEVLGQRI